MRLTTNTWTTPILPRAIDYLAEHNVIALHTFSKAYALAGLRVGYGFGRPELMRFLAQVRGPFQRQYVGASRRHRRAERWGAYRKLGRG